MIKNFCFFLSLFMLFSCTSGIKKADLIGNWRYTKIAYVSPSMKDLAPDITEQKPYFSFHQDGKAEIYSSGKVLSHGTYTIENNIIRYEEVLDGGVKRKIPFLIKELDGHYLIFQTMQAPEQIITAEKE
ncbi:MAG: hypothetical protein IE931_04060 [Sphingobacteriales bacterium]|nr:hypothetical protein [Sphingobacteriales bacterium]